MTQVVLYMSQSMLIPSEPERVAAKSSEGENQLVEQNLVIGGPPAGRLHTFCSDVDEFGGDMPFGLARGDSAGESTNKPLALFGHACVRRAGLRSRRPTTSKSMTPPGRRLSDVNEGFRRE
jgi:hypothetical protein